MNILKIFFFSVQGLANHVGPSSGQTHTSCRGEFAMFSHAKVSCGQCSFNPSGCSRFPPHNSLKWLYLWTVNSYLDQPGSFDEAVGKPTEKETVSGKDSTWRREIAHTESQPESKISLLTLRGSINSTVTGSRKAKIKINEETS